MIGLVVDSSSQLPADLAERFGIVVVPLTVTVDGVDHLEGVDLDADAFWAAFAGGRVPEVSTSQPSPGRFAQAYAGLVEAGASEVLSIHITRAMSGTLDSARLAARDAGVPVRLVDSGTASFGVACCAWAAAEAIEAGADVEAAAAVAEARGSSLRTSFVVGVPELLERSGRAAGVDVAGAAGDGVAVVAMTGADVEVLGTARSLDEAVDSMSGDALARTPSLDDGLRIAVGTSDASSAPLADALAERLTGEPGVADLVRYRIGPSVGAHTGPGTAGLFAF